MARLSNEEIRRMSPIQTDAYTTLHQTEKAIAYGVETGVLYAKPDIPEIA